eukprot:6208536-Ditylum_brightwellii.AAC.1
MEEGILSMANTNEKISKANLENLGILPDDTEVFTSDAMSMYTKINIDYPLEAMDTWLKEHKEKIPKQFPTKLILEALRLVMQSNVFSSGNTWWNQLIGIVMGTPRACIINVLYFCLFKRHFLVNKENGFSATTTQWQCISNLAHKLQHQRIKKDF